MADKEPAETKVAVKRKKKTKRGVAASVLNRSQAGSCKMTNFILNVFLSIKTTFFLTEET